jgi:hypothetical protein
MKKYGRLLIFILSVILILILGLAFWPYLLVNIIQPLAKMLWLLLRISILSIDQNYYWGALVLSIFFLFFHRLSQQTGAYYYEETTDPNATLKNIDFWSSFFQFTHHDAESVRRLKSELARLLISLYASDQRSLTNFEILEALKARTIPLPEHIYSYLFDEDTQEKKDSIKHFLGSIRQIPQTWVRRWTKRDQTEHYLMIAEVLTFMETSLEVKYDDK